MVYLLLLTLLARLADASQCGSAFALQIQDILVDPKNPASFEKGVQVTVGTPSQNVMVLPWAELNNTYIYDQNEFCDPTIIYDNQTCFVRRGGLFAEANSNTFDQTTDLIAAGGASQETSSDQAEFGIKSLVRTSLGGIDKITFGSAPAIEAFPIGIPRQAWDGGYSTLSAWGLGANSSYLNALYNTKQIASRVWSVYWGRMWTDVNSLNGSVVIGGYDRKKVQGSNYTQKLDYSSGCFTGLQVTITDVQLNPRAAAPYSLLNANSATAVSACIVPTRQLLFQGPPQVRENFQQYVDKVSDRDSFGVHWAAMVFDGSDIYSGDITFTLSTGMQVRVANDQFVTKSIYYADGSRLYNESSTDVLIGVVAEQISTLGRYFLTAAYVMVNHDEATWTIWNANPTSSTDLATVVKAGNQCGVSSGVAPAGTSTSNPSLSPSSSHPAGLATGAVVGIVMCAVLLIAILALVSYILISKRRRIRQSEETVPQDLPSSAWAGRYELHQPEKAPQNFGITVEQHQSHAPAEVHAGTASFRCSSGSQPPRYYELPSTSPLMVRQTMNSG